jgi:hypothetical protein
MSLLVEDRVLDGEPAPGFDHEARPKTRGADMTTVRVPRTARRTTVLVLAGDVRSGRSHASFGRLLPCEGTRFRRWATRSGASANHEPFWVSRTDREGLLDALVARRNP